MKKYVLALDQGTTSSRAMLYDRELVVIGEAKKEFPQIYPHPGWVEQDPMDILSSQTAAIEEAVKMSGAAPDEIAAIGIANQRETTILWDKNTGIPVSNAIVWQCRRTAPIVQSLVDAGQGEKIRKTTGLVPDAYFSATKIKWILNNVPGVREKAQRGDILFGTVDSWLAWNLTRGRAHITDYTNASRTMIYDIHSLDWDGELLRALDIPRGILPAVKNSSEIYGYFDMGGARVPLAGIAGDQQAALFGQACFEAGEAKITYGTGCFLLMNTGNVPYESQNGLVTTIGAGLNGSVQYALEGSVFVGGAVVQWLRDELGLIADSGDTGKIAMTVPDTGGVYMVPAFTGLGAPHWDMAARGVLIGITRGTGRAQVIRAADESIAYQCLDVVRAMEKDTGIKLKSLNADGGASRDTFLMQFQADILGIPVKRPANAETTALGAAFLAGLATGFWKDKAELKALLRGADVFTPDMPDEKRKTLLHGWWRALERSFGWAEE